MKKFLCKKELAEIQLLKKSNKRLKIVLAIALGATALSTIVAIRSYRNKNV